MDILMAVQRTQFCLEKVLWIYLHILYKSLNAKFPTRANNTKRKWFAMISRESLIAPF